MHGRVKLIFLKLFILSNNKNQQTTKAIKYAISFIGVRNNAEF